MWATERVKLAGACLREFAVRRECRFPAVEGQISTCSRTYIPTVVGRTSPHCSSVHVVVFIPRDFNFSSSSFSSGVETGTGGIVFTLRKPNLSLMEFHSRTSASAFMAAPRAAWTRSRRRAMYAFDGCTSRAARIRRRAGSGSRGPPCSCVSPTPRARRPLKCFSGTYL